MIYMSASVAKLIFVSWNTLVALKLCDRCYQFRWWTVYSYAIQPLLK